MTNKEADEKIQEINNQLAEIKKQQDECIEMQRVISLMEDESYWHNKKIKDVNDDMINNYSANKRLQAIFIEKEELLQQKVGLEKMFFEESRDLIEEQKRKLEHKKEIYEEEKKWNRRKNIF